MIRSYLFFFLTITRSGRLAKVRWSVRIFFFFFFFDYHKVESSGRDEVLECQRSLCVSFSRTDSRLCIYHLFVWSNFNFLHNSQWITFPTQSCLVLYSFCVNLLNSLYMWLVVSSLKPYYLHLLFCCVLSIIIIIIIIISSSSSSSSSKCLFEAFWDRSYILQLISPLLSCFTAFFKLSGKVWVFVSLFAFLYFHSVVHRNGKIH